MLPFSEYKNRNPKGGYNCLSGPVSDIVGKDGITRTFTFQIFELTQRDTSGGEFDSYEFRAKDMQNTAGEYISILVTDFSGVYQVTNITSSGFLLREKGIPEILISYSSSYLMSNVESSSNIKDQQRYFGEKRYSDGDKVWQRLMAKKPTKVSYDQTVDRYTFRYP